MKDGGAAGAHQVVGELPRGWDTLCEKGYEGGVDLSGGQWQRLALVRAYYRGAGLLICDEPTSSMDPAAEIAAFQQIRDLAGDGQTVILVTHRPHSVRSADVIHVLDQGRLVEAGDFAALMAEGHQGPGLFRKLFTLHSEQYRTGGPEVPGRSAPPAPRTGAERPAERADETVPGSTT
ncbi:ATP-binding cassette domain-containing protein [Streptomyces odonnellii]|uniref:ATP-binding cassette domain-containing protein n=1 Tax=Streptomyces odonnellii TaxID=1417980 RepID=UPI0006976F5B|nr:ABC transporter ATP-binding protein [Streptomyces odonnellii]